MARAIPSIARAPTTSTPTTRHKTFKNISTHSIHPHSWTFARVLRVSRPSARARISTIQPCARWRPERRPAPTRPRARRRDESRDATHANTYLDLGRLEGGDAGDEGGREKGRHFQGNAVCKYDASRPRVARHVDRSIDPIGCAIARVGPNSIDTASRWDGISNPHAYRSIEISRSRTRHPCLRRARARSITAIDRPDRAIDRHRHRHRHRHRSRCIDRETIRSAL
jgi:hypothetical protein